MAAFALPYVMACLRDEWGLTREYGDALEIKGRRKIFSHFSAHLIVNEQPQKLPGQCYL